MDDFQKHLQESLHDKDFKEAYDKKELRFKVIDILVRIRVQYKNLVKKLK